MRTLLLGAALAALLSSPSTAQGCSIQGDRFLQNDNLPAVPPPVPTGVAVIRGLCEGEAAFTIFDNVQGMVNVNEVAVMFGAQGGVGGNVAALDVIIYDGVTENAGGVIGQYQLGTQRWGLVADGNSNAQVQSHAVNVIDLRSFGDGTVGPQVEITSGKMVVEVKVDVNQNGACASGYFANLATDYGGTGATCPTPGVNGIRSLSNGAFDPATFGFPSPFGPILLCDPLNNFYAGNWIIRACITEEQPAAITSWSGVAQAGGAVIIEMNAPASANNNYFVLLSGGISTGTPTPWGTWPLDYDIWMDFFLGAGRNLMSFGFPNGPTGPLPGVGALDNTGFATSILALPTNASVSGLTLYASFFAWDPLDLFNWTDIGSPSDPIIFQ